MCFRGTIFSLTLQINITSATYWYIVHYIITGKMKIIQSETGFSNITAIHEDENKNEYYINNIIGSLFC